MLGPQRRGQVRIGVPEGQKMTCEGFGNERNVALLLNGGDPFLVVVDDFSMARDIDRLWRSFQAATSFHQGQTLMIPGEGPQNGWAAQREACGKAASA